MRKQFGVSIVVAFLAIGLFAGSVHAAPSTWHVRTDGNDTTCDGTADAATGAPGGHCAFATVQKAVTTAADGDTITVHAGIFTEQVNITKSLTLTGAGAANTKIQAPATLTTDADGKKNIVEFRGAITDTMSGFTVLGPGPSGCGSIDTGIAILGGATLNVSATNITSLRDNPFSGCQNGEGIRAGTPRYAGTPQVGHLTATNLTITDFQKNAVIFAGTGTTGSISDSILTGAGATPTIAQNGVEILDGAVATANHNTISGFECNAAPCGSDPLTQDYATGFLISGAGAGTTITNNTISNCDVGVYSSGAGTTVTGNTLTGNRFEGMFFDQGTATATGNSITGGNVGVEVIAFAASDGTTGNTQVTFSNNLVTGATGAGIKIQDKDNTDAFTPTISGTNNNISGNAVGVNNTTTGAINFASNFWGSANGPANLSNTYGVGSQGNAVQGNVTFVPWLSTISGSPGSFTGTAFAPVTTTSPVGQYSSIQAGVTASDPGGTVNVAAGTYTEQVTIPKRLILTGAGAATTTIKAPGVLANDAFGNKTIVEFTGGITDTMSGFTVSGPGPSSCGSIDTGIIITGGANLTLSGTTIASIRDQPFSGCQNGEGIRVGSTHAGGNSTGTLTATGITVQDYQKNGITIKGGGTTATVSGSTVTGAGATTAIAQNGIQVSADAVATLTNNTISGNECNVAVCGPNPLTDTQSTGILLFDPAAGLTIQGNTVTGNDIGIYNYVPANSGTALSKVSGNKKTSAHDSGPIRNVAGTGSPTKITGNTLTNNRYEGIFLDQGNATVTNNTVTGGNISVEAASFGGNDGNSQGALTGNTFSGATVAAIQLQDDTTTDAFIPIVNGSSNQISGAAGVNNTTTGKVDLTKNWWGQNTGPTNASNVGGTGASVTANVTFSPWCNVSACTDFYGIPTKLVFTTQPAGASAGTAFTTQPAVTAQDPNGFLGFNFGAGVTVAIGTNPSAGVLSGTVTVNATHGVVTFAGLAIDKPGTGYTLTASATGLTQGTSAAFTVSSIATLSVPTIVSVNPPNGGTAGLQYITITGTNFVAGDTVTFGTTASPDVKIVSSTQIQAQLPAHAAGKVDVKVANANGQGTTLANGFEYDPSGTTGARPAGNGVTITGNPNNVPTPRPNNEPPPPPR